MNTIKDIMDQQISEGDLMVLLLVESVYQGRTMTYREVAERLQTSHATIATRYQRAAKLMEKQAIAREQHGNT